MADPAPGALNNGEPRPAEPETFKMHELCRTIGKSNPCIRRLQNALALPIPTRPERYPEKYMLFIRRIVALRTFNVPVDEIKELLEKEKKILQLLHFDSVAHDACWFMSSDDPPVPSDRHLLLSGIDLGTSLTSSEIQCNLDFHDRGAELFSRREMGEDIRHVLDLYVELLKQIDKRVSSEKPVLEEALAWAGRGLVHTVKRQSGR